jgi:hypothetical protein
MTFGHCIANSTHFGATLGTTHLLSLYCHVKGASKQLHRYTAVRQVRYLEQDSEHTGGLIHAGRFLGTTGARHRDSGLADNAAPPAGTTEVNAQAPAISWLSFFNFVTLATTDDVKSLQLQRLRAKIWRWDRKWKKVVITGFVGADNP